MSYSRGLPIKHRFSNRFAGVLKVTITRDSNNKIANYEPFNLHFAQNNDGRLGSWEEFREIFDDKKGETGGIISSRVESKIWASEIKSQESFKNFSCEKVIRYLTAVQHLHNLHDDTIKLLKDEEVDAEFLLGMEKKELKEILKKSGRVFRIQKVLKSFKYTSGSLKDDKEHLKVMSLRRITFTKATIYAAPLPGKAAIEAGRIALEVLTLGLASLSRATAGNANHWFVVLEGEFTSISERGSSVRKCYCAIDYGARDVFTMMQVAAKGFVQNITHKVPNITLFNTKEDALNFQKCHKNSRVFRKGSQKKLRKPMTLEDIVHNLYTEGSETRKSIQRGYKWDSNNCQHFATKLMNQIAG
mmetsp:Transcript_36029/g.57848  ORF Transcript_36029/g.57848 Transcript_36029/m.57848 type:complete len:359 (+) Transcript_36029:72-1148(+)|eukprot:jgi/Bigna1/85072/estExt_fgenesh1_pg.C_20090